MSLNGIKKLTTGGVLAHMLYQLENMGVSWFAPFTRRVTSVDPRSEEHAWLTGSATVTEKTGDNEFAEPAVAGQIVRNKNWNCGVRVPLNDWLANKADVVQGLIDEAVEKALAHPGLRVQELVVAGYNTNCYDGQYYFDNDHSEGSSGTQDNDITLAKAGTLPTVAECKALILKACTQVMKFKDAKGDFVNMGAKDFTVVAPPDIFTSVAEACISPLIGGGDSNLLASGQLFMVKPQVLPGWSGNQLAVFRNRTPNRGSAFIHQIFTDPEPIILGPESERAKEKDEVLIKVRGTYQVAYGRWAEACLGTFTGP